MQATEQANKERDRQIKELSNQLKNPKEPASQVVPARAPTLAPAADPPNDSDSSASSIGIVSREGDRRAQGALGIWADEDAVEAFKRTFPYMTQDGVLNHQTTSIKKKLLKAGWSADEINVFFEDMPRPLSINKALLGQAHIAAQHKTALDTMAPFITAFTMMHIDDSVLREIGSQHYIDSYLEMWPKACASTMADENQRTAWLAARGAPAVDMTIINSIKESRTQAMNVRASTTALALDTATKKLAQLGADLKSASGHKKGSSTNKKKGDKSGQSNNQKKGAPALKQGGEPAKQQPSSH